MGGDSEVPRPASRDDLSELLQTLRRIVGEPGVGLGSAAAEVSAALAAVASAMELGAVVPQGALRQSIPGFTLGGAFYVVATLIAAFWSPVAALIIYGLLGVYYLFEHLPSPAEESAAGKPPAS